MIRSAKLVTETKFVSSYNSLQLNKQQLSPADNERPTKKNRFLGIVFHLLHVKDDCYKFITGFLEHSDVGKKEGGRWNLPNKQQYKTEKAKKNVQESRR